MLDGLPRRWLLLALLAHIPVLAVVLLGVQCSPKPNKPHVIEAVLLPEGKAAAPRPTAKASPKPAPKPEPEPPAPKVEPQPPAEPPPPKAAPPPPKADPPVAVEAPKPKPSPTIAPPKPKPEPQPKQPEPDNLADALREEEQLRKRQKDEKALKDRLRNEQEQREAEAALQKLAAQENAAASAKAVGEVRASWVNRVLSTIANHYERPPGSLDDYQCRIELSLQPNGQVVGLRFLQSCGDAEVDDAVRRAVYRGAPFAPPQDARAFVPRLTITFKP